jgi:hypothetical protein
MTIRIPDLRVQANMLGDALKAGIGAQRGKILNLVARMNGLNSWQHAVSLGKATPDAAEPYSCAPVPLWVYQMVDAPPEVFRSMAVAARQQLFTLIALAGFSPFKGSEFSRVIAPNAVQSLIAEPDYIGHFATGDLQGPYGWCVTSYDRTDSDSFDAKVLHCQDWLTGISGALSLAEQDRLSTLNHPDAWEHDLSWRLHEKGIDWETMDWRNIKRD